MASLRFPLTLWADAFCDEQFIGKENARENRPSSEDGIGCPTQNALANHKSYVLPSLDSKLETSCVVHFIAKPVGAKNKACDVMSIKTILGLPSLMPSNSCGSNNFIRLGGSQWNRSRMNAQGA